MAIVNCFEACKCEVGSLHNLLFARSLGHRFGAGAAPFGSAFRTRVPRPSGFGLLPPRRLRVPFQKLLLLATRLRRDLGAATFETVTNVWSAAGLQEESLAEETSLRKCIRPLGGE